MSTTFPIKGDADKKIGAFFAPLSVSAQDAPNLTVKIRAGSFINSQNVFVEYAGGSSASIAAPVTASRWSVVGLTDSGTVTVIHGTTSGAPSVPEIPSGVLPLAAIFMASTSTTITDAQVMDIRPFVRSVDNVPNLSTELADRPTTTDLNNALLLKADVDGTPNIVFTLNKDALSGTPNDNIDLVVKRGASPDVSIRWNETSDWWEFTNDGTTFSPFVSSVGTFAPINHTHVPADITNFNSTVDARIATATIAQSQVTSLVSDLSGKASASTVSTHIADSSIHFTLPIAQASVTGLTADLASKVNSAAPGTLTGNLTVKTTGNQPITLTSSDTGSSGLVIDRTTVPGPNARFEWDETSEAWLIGTTGNMDTVLTDAVVATKADKVSGAVNGNFAGLNASGNLTDSGFNSSSFVAANAPIVAGTATKITYDADGLVVSGTTLGATDITSAFTIAQNQVMAGPVSGAATNPAFRALVAADIPTIAQSQVTNLVSDLSGKASTTHTHVKADITDFAHTHLLVDVTDVTASAAELNFSVGVTSDIQTQINGKASTSHTHVISDVTNLQTSLDGKLDEIVAVNGNFATFGGAGTTLTDSGVSTASFATAAQGTLADSALQSSDIGVSIQAYDADLGAIAALTGTSGLLQTDGAGVWSVDTNTYVTGPAGANTQLQFNNSGAFGASPNLNWTNASGKLTINSTNTLAKLEINYGEITYKTDPAFPGDSLSVRTYDAINPGEATPQLNFTTGTAEADGTTANVKSGDIYIAPGTMNNTVNTVLSSAGSVLINGGSCLDPANVDGGTIILAAGQGSNAANFGIIECRSNKPVRFNTQGNNLGAGLQLYDGIGIESVVVKAPDTVTASRTWTLPQNDPTTVANRFLTTDSSGQWSFAAIPVLPTYTVGTLPTGVAGGMIYVSDAAPNPAMCFYNGTSWIDVVTGVAVV